MRNEVGISAQIPVYGSNNFFQDKLLCFERDSTLISQVFKSWYKLYRTCSCSSNERFFSRTIRYFPTGNYTFANLDSDSFQKLRSFFIYSFSHCCHQYSWRLNMLYQIVFGIIFQSLKALNNISVEHSSGPGKVLRLLQNVSFGKVNDTISHIVKWQEPRQYETPLEISTIE